MPKQKTSGAPQGSAKRLPRRWALLPTLCAGTYAWSLTVLPAALTAGLYSLSSLFALFAIAALLISLLLPAGRPSMVAALDVFLTFCLVSWWFAREQADVAAYPLLGALGWLFYTLAIGAFSSPATIKGPVSAGALLQPRVRSSRISTILLVMAVVTALFLMISAWKVERPAMGVLSHVLALAATLLVFRTAGGLAVYFQRRGTPIPSELSFRRAILPLCCLASLLAGAAFWAFKPG